MFEPSYLSMLLTCVSAILGWFLRELWSAVKELKEDLVNLKDNVNTNFVRRDELREFRNEIISHLIRIETKLDNKQDK